MSAQSKMEKVYEIAHKIEQLKTQMKKLLNELDMKIEIPVYDLDYYRRIVVPLITEITGVTFEEMIGHNRAADKVDARRILCKLMRDDGMTYIGIANFLKKDHSTIISHIQKHETDVKFVPKYRVKYESVIVKLGRY